MPSVDLSWAPPGMAAQDWVRHAIHEVKAGDPLAPVTVIVPNYYAGRQLRWALARAGGCVNVRTLLLGDVATQLLSGTVGGESPLTVVVEESAVREAVRRVGGVLTPLAHHRALHQALLHLFRELRRNNAELGASNSEMGRAAAETHRVFRELIAPFSDRTRLREVAAERLLMATEPPAPLEELGTILVHQLPRIDPADARLLASIARWTSLRAVFARFDAEDVLANALPSEGARLLLAELDALGIQTSVTEGSVEEVTPNVAVIRAPDPAEEVREVVRSIARRLEGDSPTPIHRAAILYRQADPYASLVRESLTLAELPWSALDGRALAESRPGRTLLAALAIREQDFAREAVLGWVDVAPRRQTVVAGSAWDRLSRAANIVRGAGQWQQRLADYAARQRDNATQRELESGEAVAGTAPAVAALRFEADMADRMFGVIRDLAQSLMNRPDGAPWSELVDWAERVWERHCGGVSAWPDDEHGYATDIAATLAELREADRIEQATSVPLSLFLETLRETLEGRARPVGSLGRGILVGPVQAVTGLGFDDVYIVGMTERAFPAPPAVEPFLAAGEPLADAVRERRRAAERLAFRIAVAAADRALTLSAPDSIGGRKAFPSPWLLELAATPAGRHPLLTSAFFQLPESTNGGWLRVVSSGLDGIRRSPVLADQEEHRLRAAAASEFLVSEPIALRDDLPLGRGLHAGSARVTAEFTAFDGNVGEVLVSAGDVQRLFAAAQVLSASGIESWATCPFRFFLGRVLRVQPTERPDDAWSVDPLERGSLVHRILERFFGTLQSRGRLVELSTYTRADRELMDGIADDCIADIERRGVAGHPLIWENTVATIRADLHVFLSRDEAWRQSRGLRPTYFEQPFGIESRAHSWPAVAMSVGELEVAFHGVIDRIDLSADGTRAFLYDYKTGGSSAYRGMNEDPLMAGRHVQLALYRRALLETMPELDDDSVEGAFWFVTSRGEFKMLPSEPSDHDIDRRLDEVLDVTARGIRGGFFPQVPGDETSRPGRFGWDNCLYCDYDRVCPAGRDAVWERKQDSPGHVHHRALAPLAPAELVDVEEP
ncbi:MAG TPA: PD-(D/E)XK nuclease family protein [Chloroflexota bacterium]